MKVTKRQKEFINKLIVLYKDSNEPIHYSDLAEKLDVSPFTAYDMLRVLEEKGFVDSEYQMPDGTSGRSIRVFIPTSKALNLINKIVDEHAEIRWDEIDQTIRCLIDKGLFREAEIGLEIFARIPPGETDEIHFCLEIISILMLRVRNNQHIHTFQKAYLNQMGSDKYPLRSTLNLITGFALGVLPYEISVDDEWSELLIQNVLRYQEILQNFADHQILQLADYLQAHLNQAIEQINEYQQTETLSGAVQC